MQTSFALRVSVPCLLLVGILGCEKQEREDVEPTSQLGTSGTGPSGSGSGGGGSGGGTGTGGGAGTGGEDAATTGSTTSTGGGGTLAEACDAFCNVDPECAEACLAQCESSIPEECHDVAAAFYACAAEQPEALTCEGGAGYTIDPGTCAEEGTAMGDCL